MLKLNNHRKNVYIGEKARFLVIIRSEVENLAKLRIVRQNTTYR